MKFAVENPFLWLPGKIKIGACQRVSLLNVTLFKILEERADHIARLRARQRFSVDLHPGHYNRPAQTSLLNPNLIADTERAALDSSGNDSSPPLDRKDLLYSHAKSGIGRHNRFSTFSL